MDCLKEKLARQISSLELDLNGKVVLTEAANGPYVVTALMAAMAGAKVYAYAKDSAYGSAKEVISYTKKQAATLGKTDISYLTKVQPKHIASADIITNSGHLRPLNSSVLKHVKSGVVIASMYEKWELRESDIDLKYCKKYNIPVCTTNERHPKVNVFGYLGEMGLKLISDAAICATHNTFIIISNNDFGPHIAKTLLSIAAKVGVIDLYERRKEYPSEITWLSNFPSIEIPEEFRHTEAVIYTAYPFAQNQLKTSALNKLRKQLNHPYLLRFAGDIDTVACKKHHIRFFPEKVKSGHMGIIPSAIGWDPVIRLQSGGLKSAESFLKGKHTYDGLPILEII